MFHVTELNQTHCHSIWTAVKCGWCCFYNCCLFHSEDVKSAGVKKAKNVQRCTFLLNWLWAVSPFIKSSNSSIINFQTIPTGIQKRRIFFNQTSKQLIFIEQPFGLEPTIRLLCWFWMLLLSCLILIFGVITISFKLLLTQFRSLKGAFHLHSTEAQERTPSDWPSLNHKL